MVTALDLDPVAVLAADCSFLNKRLINLAPRAGLARANDFNGLNRQTSLIAQIEPKRLFAALSNLIVEDDGTFALNDYANGFPSRLFAMDVAAVQAGRARPAVSS